MKVPTLPSYYGNTDVLFSFLFFLEYRECLLGMQVYQFPLTFFLNILCKHSVGNNKGEVKNDHTLESCQIPRTWMAMPNKTIDLECSRSRSQSSSRAIFRSTFRVGGNLEKLHTCGSASVTLFLGNDTLLQPSSSRPKKQWFEGRSPAFMPRIFEIREWDRFQWMSIRNSKNVSKRMVNLSKWSVLINDMVVESDWSNK
jgi:hypothetical protein